MWKLSISDTCINYFHSFPGGIRDETDTDFVHTALRETQEELGIEPSVFDIWGQMNPLPGSVSTHHS